MLYVMIWEGHVWGWLHCYVSIQALITTREVTAQGKWCRTEQQGEGCAAASACALLKRCDGN